LVETDIDKAINCVVAFYDRNPFPGFAALNVIDTLPIRVAFAHYSRLASNLHAGCYSTPSIATCSIYLFAPSEFEYVVFYVIYRFCSIWMDNRYTR